MNEKEALEKLPQFCENNPEKPISVLFTNLLQKYSSSSSLSAHRKRTFQKLIQHEHQ